MTVEPRMTLTTEAGRTLLWTFAHRPSLLRSTDDEEWRGSDIIPHLLAIESEARAAALREVAEKASVLMQRADDAASCPYGGHLSGCDHRPDVAQAETELRAILAEAPEDRGSATSPTTGSERSDLADPKGASE